MHTVAIAALICAGALFAGFTYQSAVGLLGMPTIALIVIAVGTTGTSLRRLTHLVARLR